MTKSTLEKIREARANKEAELKELKDKEAIIKNEIKALDVKEKEAENAANKKISKADTVEAIYKEIARFDNINYCDLSMNKEWHKQMAKIIAVVEKYR